ncbi:porin family protein [Brucella sp. 21LCYQ03]|nr:porin family protein [Brucella sp. 21LCYQ03]
MKDKLLSTTALAAIFSAAFFFAAPAYAADVIEEPPVPPVAPLIASPFIWTGPYIGAQIGYGWGKGNNVTDNASENGPAGTGFDNLRMRGLFGGIHAGYNYQFANPFVIGIEGDINYSDINGSHHLLVPGYDDSLSLKTNWQGSARLRAGYAIDKTLIYATGGLAFAGAELKTGGISDKNTHVGWTAGAGIEHAFTPNWIGRFEVRYSDFNKKTYDTPLGDMKLDFNQTTATVGISYKF